MDFFSWVLDHWAFSAFVLACVVQITPIFKFNPISALFGLIGKMANKPLVEKLEKLEEQVSGLNESVEENEMDRIRWEVLNFANSCRNGVRHTRDEFTHIIALNDKYKKLLAATGQSNGVFDMEYVYITEIYKKLQQTNDFLR